MRAAQLALDEQPLPADRILAGEPVVRGADLPAPPGLDCGVWEHTAGTSSDVEADEVFVVLAGRATIEAADGTVVTVGPGDVGVLTAGLHTRWTVHEDLRKVWVTPAER